MLTNLSIINRLKLFNSCIDNFKYGKYDLIISNPPYINKFDLKYLDKDVINFEPKLALKWWTRWFIRNQKSNKKNI